MVEWWAEVSKNSKSYNFSRIFCIYDSIMIHPIDEWNALQRRNDCNDLRKKNKKWLEENKCIFYYRKKSVK